MPWIVFTNIYVALCGAALTAASYALLGHAVRIDHVAGLVFCCTLVVYNLDRLVEPHPGNSEHERWVEKHRAWLWALTGIAAVGAGVLTLWLNPMSRGSLVPAGLVALGYCLPMVGKKRFVHGKDVGLYRLKDLPGAKLILIALVWTYATAVLPMLESGTALDRHSAMVLLARFFFLAAVALPFDLPDMQRDQNSGIKTVPILLGIQKTRQLAFGLIVISAAFPCLNPWPHAWALLASCACVTGLIAALKPDRGVLYFMVALDGMLLVQAGLLWVSAR